MTSPQTLNKNTFVKRENFNWSTKNQSAEEKSLCIICIHPSSIKPFLKCTSELPIEQSLASVPLWGDVVLMLPFYAGDGICNVTRAENSFITFFPVDGGFSCKTKPRWTYLKSFFHHNETVCTFSHLFSFLSQFVLIIFLFFTSIEEAYGLNISITFAINS